MSRAVRQQRTSIGRRHFRLEWLEPRQLLSSVPEMLMSPAGSSTGALEPRPIPGSLCSGGGDAGGSTQPSAINLQSLVTTVPANGATLTKSPDHLVVNFSKT